MPRLISYRSLLHSRNSSWVLVFALLFTGCSGYSGPSEYELQQNEFQGIIDQVVAAGGSAKREGKSLHGMEGVGWTITLSGATITDELLDAIIKAAAKDAVFQLDLDNSTITDDQLEKLDEAKVLQKTFNLNLSNTAITDAGLDKLDHMHCIADLKLKGSKATLAGAKRLGQRKIASPQTPPVLKKQPEITI